MRTSLIFIALILSSAFSAVANVVKAPDFAYPKIVIEDADSAYRVALKTGDEIAQLEAAIQIYLADMSIDQSSSTKSIKSFVERTKNIKTPSTRAIAKLYEASTYFYALRKDQYKYTRRNLPLTPRPVDLSEWSATMFNVVIDSLTTDALQLADNTPLTQFKKIVDANDLTLQFFPTVKDFIASYALNQHFISEPQKLVDSMKEFHSPCSDAWYAWNTMALDFSYGSITETFIKNALELYLSTPQYSGRSFTLSKIIPHVKFVRNQPSQQIAFLDSALIDFKGTWIENNIQEKLAKLREGNLDIFVTKNKIVADSEHVELKLTYRNISTAKINIYNLPFNEQYPPKSYDVLSKFKPIQSIDLNFHNKSANPQDSSIFITLPLGVNYILAKIPAAANYNAQPIEIDSYKLSTVVISEGSRCKIYVLDAASGLPVKDVSLYSIIKKNGKNPKLIGVTNKSGIISLNEAVKGNLQLSYNGVTHQYLNNYHTSQPYNSTNKPIIDLTSDLSIYKRGANVRFVGCVADSVGAVENYPITIVLKDSENNSIDTTHLVSDSFGRFSGSFKLPEETRTGRFCIHASGKISYPGTVYFQVSDFKLPPFKADSVFVYGSGPTKSDITATGRITTYTGFPLESIQIKLFVNDKTYSTTSASDGHFFLNIDSVFSKQNNNGLNDPSYSAIYPQFKSVSISATSPDGTTLDIFSGNVSIYPNDLLVPDLHKSFNTDSVILLKPKLKSPEGKYIDSKLRWRILSKNDSVLVSGTAYTNKFELNLSTLKPGKYKINIVPDDSLAQAVTESIVLYSAKSNILPIGELIWAPDNKVNVNNGKLTARILVAEPGANVFYGILDYSQNLKCEFLTPGWHEISVIIDNNKLTNQKQFIAFAVHNFKNSEIRLHIPQINEATKDNLNILIESFRDKVYTSDVEKWTLRVVDSESRGIESCLVLNVYNSKLNDFDELKSLYPYKYTRPDLPTLLRLDDRYHHDSFSISSSLRRFTSTSVLFPKWNNYNSNINLNRGSYYNNTHDYSLGSIMPKYRGLMKESNEDSVVVYNLTSLATADVSYAEDVVSFEHELSDDTKTDIRMPEIFSAMWEPMLVTDADGVKDISFTVPNALTSWSLVAYAWDKKMNSTKLSRTITATKSVMVTSNVPRFVRSGDKAVIVTSVMNNTDREIKVQVLSETFNTNNDSALTSFTHNIIIAPGESELVSTEIDVPNSTTDSSLGFRIRAISDSHSDGEQFSLPVLSAESFVREAINFYLNPGNSCYTTTLPSPQGSNFKSEFSFTANPMATIIDALPTLWKDPAPTTFSLTTTYFGAAIALGLAKNHQAVAEKFDRRELTKLSDEVLEKLLKLQRKDGGWAWGEWSSESSPWMTSYVLDRICCLIDWNYLPDNKDLNKALASAVKYYDSKVRGHDMLYTIIRPSLNKFSLPSLNGQNVINRTLNDITRNWKKYSTDSKALSVIALHKHDRKATARSIISSLDQYAVTTPSKGTVFRNERSLMSYGHLLEAYASVAPKSPTIDGLRQYLIIHRQATDWGNYNQTSYVVSSFLNSGTQWAEPKLAPKLTVDDNEVSLNAPKGNAMIYTAPVSGKNLQLDLSETSAPSYGSIVSSYIAPMNEIKAYSEDDEIFIDKRLLVRDASGKMLDAPSQLSVGMKVTVSITIKTSRPMSYVNICDQRPACFEPVVQLSQAVWQDALLYYRENRDSETRIFVDYLPEGTNVISYDVTVNNAGNFASGIVTATCDMAPSLTAHSAGSTLSVLP